MMSLSTPGPQTDCRQVHRASQGVEGGGGGAEVTHRGPGGGQCGAEAEGGHDQEDEGGPL